MNVYTRPTGFEPVREFPSISSTARTKPRYNLLEDYFVFSTNAT